VGSRSKTKEDEYAYIAGFLDGDGSLMLQVKKRRDSKKGWRIMMTICLYQDSRHEKPLFWMRRKLGIGYISRRNDGISELRVNGHKQIQQILKLLLPFIRFKRVQAMTLFKAATLLNKKSSRYLTRKERCMLIGWILNIQSQNYVARRKKTRKELEKVLDLTP